MYIHNRISPVLQCYKDYRSELRVSLIQYILKHVTALMAIMYKCLNYFEENGVQYEGTQ